MIEQELFYKILKHYVDQNNGAIEIDQILTDLNLLEFLPKSRDIINELNSLKYIKRSSIGNSKYTIDECTYKGKCWLIDFEKQRLSAVEKNNNMQINMEKTIKDYSLDIFISHSSKDAIIVELFIELLIKAFKIDESRIRCTSIPGYKLPSGVNVDVTLKNEISTSKLFIGFITEKSLESVYVLFELGARWGSEKDFKLITSDASTFKLMQPPLSNHHTICISNRKELYQILDEIQNDLSYNPYKPISIQKEVEKLLDAISLKNQEEVTSAIIKQPQNSEYSIIELDILKSANENNDGNVRIISTQDGTTIQSGQKVLLQSDINKDIQKYKSALHNLEQKGFLKISNNSGTRYEFTDMTYKYLESE